MIEKTNRIKTPRWYHFEKGLGDLVSFSVFLGLRISSGSQVMTCMCQPVGDWFQVPESWLVCMCQCAGDWFPSYFLSLCLFGEWVFSVSYWVFLFLQHLDLSHAPPCFIALAVSLWEALLFLVWVLFGTSSSDAECSLIINFPYLAVLRLPSVYESQIFFSSILKIEPKGYLLSLLSHSFFFTVQFFTFRFWKGLFNTYITYTLISYLIQALRNSKTTHLYLMLHIFCFSCQIKA